MKSQVFFSLNDYIIIQHRFDLASPTTSPVFPLKRGTSPCTGGGEECTIVEESAGLPGDMFDSVGLEFLICALCFLRSARVPVEQTSIIQ